MTYEALQMVIGLALTDQKFLGTFMTDRPRALAGLPLTEEEAGVLLTTPGRTFEDFSQKLDSWITRRTRSELRVAHAAGVHEWP